MFAVLEVLKNAGIINMDITVTVNGDKIVDEHVDMGSFRNFFNKLDALDLTDYMKVDGQNNVTITRVGQGQLFYELAGLG